VHGLQRDALQKEMNSNIRQRSELHVDGKLGQLIQLMSGKPKKELDFQTLPSEEEGMIIDHQCIQLKVISYFKEWHYIPKTGPRYRLFSNPPAILATSPSKADNQQNSQQVVSYS
jgi:hypothetical protein